MKRLVRYGLLCALLAALLAVASTSGAATAMRAPAQAAAEELPPLFADFDYSPPDPSRFDTIGFVSLCYGPDGALITRTAWDFGDGATADGGWPSHQYAADGDYTVTRVCGSDDGRTTTAAKTVSVRTHDVEVVLIHAPKSAKVGQTRQVFVDVRNTRYDETVRVGLWRSAFPGNEEVASLAQFIPAGKSARFAFDYTFTAADAAIGKVTFMAFATLADARDAIDADNMLIAPPTAVNP